MATSNVTQESESLRTTHRRYWRRVTEPKSWWPGGLLPLLGLVALFLFGAIVTAPAIEADVNGEVSERLAGADFSVDSTSGDGQQISVTVRDAGDRLAYAEALAASTRCDTWAGRLTCPTVVRIANIESPAPAMAAERGHPFAIVRDGNAVTLAGETPSAEERDRIVKAARDYFDAVNGELTVSGDRATAEYGRAADRALAVLDRLQSGTARWSGDALSISGEAPAEVVDAAYAEYAAMGSGAVLGGFDVRPLPDTDACNERFADLLRSASIRFRTASADIDSGNDALLRQLVVEAQACPGNLTIAGHTDSQGDAAMNQALSEARAAAVREALIELGVAPGRLDSVGYGESQPIADNATAAGRAQNRRIVITVNRPD